MSSDAGPRRDGCAVAPARPSGARPASLLADRRVINVLQGESRISDDPDAVMTTILGSCIATAIWDPVTGVGGMNHFLLPGGDGEHGGHMRYGVNAMELLLNGLLKRGADRRRLQVKLFGGAKMFEGGKEIGAQNIAFAEWFMASEGLDVVARCVGGRQGRKIRFWPVTGRAQKAFLNDMRALPPEKTASRPEPLPEPPGSGDIQLF